MLSVAKLTPGQERYYERSVAAGLDDYYAGRGESPGVWTGRGAARSGSRASCRRASSGGWSAASTRTPRSGCGTSPAKAAHDHDRADRPAHRRAHASRPRSSPRSPGSTSSSRRRRASACSTRSATRRPAGRSTKPISPPGRRRSATSRTKPASPGAARSGVHREHAPGFVAAAYQHRTSRAQDPHLHTHVIVANMAQSPSDGKWRALDGEPILKSYRLAAGYLYQAHLRGELTRSARSRMGASRARAWPSSAASRAAVIREFSTPPGAGRRRLGAGDGGFYAAQVAALDTRERKEHVDLDRLREDWRARAAEHGLGAARAASAARPRHSRRSHPARRCSSSPTRCSARPG